MKVIRKPNRFYYYLFNLLIAHSVHHHPRSNSFTIDKKKHTCGNRLRVEYDGKMLFANEVDAKQNIFI